MANYVKIKSITEIEYAPINKDGIMNYNLDIERMLEDGYKPLIPAQPIKTNRMTHIEYREMEDSIIEEWIFDETQEEADKREQKQKQQQRNQEIDNKITELNQLALTELIQDNYINVETIKDVINSLKKSKIE